MKKITMLLLAALLLIGIASAASAFEYAPAEKLEIDGIEVNKVWVDMIPVYYTLPADYQEGQDMKICLFLSGLSGNKESLVSTYSDFITSRGYVGVFFDHYEHGERSINGTTILNSSEDEVAALKKKILDTCFENMYRYGWEILGNSILDAERVIDWFTANMPVTEVVMGGHSMGGDTSVAVAGIDERVNRILCVVTTPDWLRPGMHDLFTGEDMDPGKPDAKSQWYYDQFNPITHLSRYTRGIDVTFVCGELDKHIPPENAQRFISNLSRIAPDAAARMQIWWNKGQGHKSPSSEDLGMLFDWLLCGKDIVVAE